MGNHNVFLQKPGHVDSYEKVSEFVEVKLYVFVLVCVSARGFMRNISANDRALKISVTCMSTSFSCFYVRRKTITGALFMLFVFQRIPVDDS